MDSIGREFGDEGQTVLEVLFGAGVEKMWITLAKCLSNCDSATMIGEAGERLRP